MSLIVRYFLFFASFFLCYVQSYALVEYKLSDAIAPFFDEQKEVLHYSSIPFYQLDTKDAPFVDEKQLDESFLRYQTYIKRVSSAGYTHITLDGFDHLLTLEDIGIYKNTTKYYRHLYYKQYYKKLIKEAHAYGLGVFLVSDMQFYTTEIEKKYGLDADSTSLQEFNKQAFDEILSGFEIDGIILRFGEGGKAYNTAQYKSAIIYKTPEQVRKFIKNILPLFEKYDKKLIVRTWTIGIGEVGDFNTNLQTYNEVFSGIQSDHLIASIKYTPGDFFAFNGVNPTIGKGAIRQIIEFQVRREYEGAGEFPNFLLQDFLQVYEMMQNNDLILGCWNWNATGGWGWGKNMIFNYGFNFWNEINFWMIAEVFSGKTDADQILAGILAKLQEKYQFSIQEQEVLTEIIKNSRQIILDGWYIKEFQQKQFYFLKNYVPPLLYIWWDRPTSSPIILSLIAQNVHIPNISYQSELLQKNIDNWEKVMEDSLYQKDIFESLVYQKDLFDILFVYQHDFISWYQGKEVIYMQEKTQKILNFTQKYAGNTNFSFDFSEIYRFYKLIAKDQERPYIFGMIATFFSILIVLSMTVAAIKLLFKIKRRKWYFASQKLIIQNKNIFVFYCLFAQLIVWVLLYFFLPITRMYQFLVYFFLGSYISLLFIGLYLVINIVLAYKVSIDLEEKWGNRYISKNEKYIFGFIFIVFCFYIVSFFPGILKKTMLQELPTYFYEAGSDISQIL